MGVAPPVPNGPAEVWQLGSPASCDPGSGKNDRPNRTVWAWVWRKESSARFSSLQRVGQTLVLQGLAFAESPVPQRPKAVVHPGSVGSVGWSIDPDLSTSTITFGLNFLITMGVLLSSWEMESGSTGTNS